MKALIIIAHGSKKQSSNEEFITMVESIKKKNKYECTQAAFLELANPSIKQSIESIKDKNINKIDIYPFFLNSGKHVLIDIPNIVEELKLEYKDIEFKLLSHFGKSKNIENIILNDLQE